MNERSVLAAATVGAVIQVPLTYLGAVFPMSDGLYGAPLPVGQSPGFAIFGGEVTFSLLFWTLDLVLTTAAVYVILRFGAPTSAALVGVWAFATVLLGYAMELGVGAWSWPFAGLPIPAALNGVADGRPIHLIFLADALLISSAYVWWRRRRLARRT